MYILFSLNHRQNKRNKETAPLELNHNPNDHNNKINPYPHL